MNLIEDINYIRIEAAIDFLVKNFKDQPTLEDVAAHVHLSPIHFQKIFTEWAGTSPKKFLQYINITHAKNLLKESEQTLFNTTVETGLSSTSRLHDLFIKIEGMSPAEYKNGGENLKIEYSYQLSPFGKILIANTSKGICHISFESDHFSGIIVLQTKFPKATIVENHNPIHSKIREIFNHSNTQLKTLKLHLKGTDFQLKVWESLLKIPFGNLTTYGKIAAKIHQPNASRAVGTAIGQNPIAYLIPCHRVIQSTGIFGDYMWGKSRKTAIIGWENAIKNQNEL